MLYYGSKGLFIRKIRNETFVIEDVFGTSCLPFNSREEHLDEATNEIANITKLVTVGIDSKYPDFSDFQWDELNNLYSFNMEYNVLNAIASKAQVENLNMVSNIFPVAYLETGYGDGAKETLAIAHEYFQKFIHENDFPISDLDLQLFLIKNQVNRILRDIKSLVSRALKSYTELLKSQRKCIAEAYTSIDLLKTNEVIHTGQDSYTGASSLTSLVISLCSSLDLSAKLINYINSQVQDEQVFKAARDKQYQDVRKIKSKLLSETTLAKICSFQNNSKQIPELIQLRNDLIHSTSILELEKIWVGFGTLEVNEIPLYYSAQYARDTIESGQPERFLGRDYFVGRKLDIEIKSLSWIREIIKYHIQVGEELNSQLGKLKKSNNQINKD
tara:strand:- start:117 stop:1277 length:1161 start_codon:yes stop_codon:yes gene_type:complete